MMRKYKLLLKMQLYNFFGVNRLLHSRDASEKRRTLVIGISGGLVIALLVIYSSLFCKGLAGLGLTDVLPAIAVLICSMITLVLTFLKSTGVLIGLRDYDMVMSLPVNSIAVVSSRLTMVYFMNLAICLIAGVPSIVIYTVYAGPSAGIYFMLLLSIFLIPIIPMIVSLTIGVLITAISMRTRHKNIFSLLLSTIAVLAIVALSFQSQNMSELQIANIGYAISEAVNRIYPPSGMLQAAVTNESLPHFLAFAASSLLIGGAFIAIVSVFYKSLNTAAFSHRTKEGYKMGLIKASSPFMAMYKREFSRYFSCTIYALNSSIGMVLLLVAAIALQFVTFDSFVQQSGAGIIKQALPIVIAVFVSMTSTTSASLSLEGKNRWIMCSVPVKPIDIFKAKIAVNLTVILPITVISAALIGMATKPATLETILLFIVPSAYAFFVSVLGMFLNVKFPKYDWTSEYYAIKGGAISVLATIGGGMASSILPLLLCMVFPSASWIIMGVTVLAVSFAALMLYGKLKACRLFV